EDNLWQALKQFELAAAADPKFAEAYAGQALVYVILPDWSARITYDESFARARDNAERALSLDPSLPEPYIALGYLADGDRRRATAQALYRRAIALRPSFASAYQWLGNSLWSGGRLESGAAMLERASVLDPRSAIIANNHGMALIALGRYADAKVLCEAILKSVPDNHSCLESTGFAALQLGDFNLARSLFARYAAVTNPGAQAEVNDVFDALQGHGDRHAIAIRMAAFQPQSATDPGSGNAFQAYVIPTLLVELGEPQLALANLQAWAYSDRAGMSEWAVMQPALGPLHCDPGFVALVRKIKTSDPHYAKLCARKS
ncbi:MAG: tetratricopeptide repeat protein, partial [Rhodanobacteraceae bacterium]